MPFSPCRIGAGGFFFSGPDVVERAWQSPRRPLRHGVQGDG